jgi:DNA repair exonuclease SbcCD ATPase subunit
MITLKQLKFSNAFSYGENNEISFTKGQLTQLVGKNGHGKSSIALILEEVIFNKNSKGIKKSDIINRHNGAKSYWIELTFDKDGTSYRIETKRGSTQTVKLFKAGQDISEHTATATYKAIEEIIGMDHKTFAQIVYQSHAGSLEFLTSPDTARKKFLIELLNLSKYIRAGDVFKTVATEVSKELTVAQSKVDTISQWIDKYEKADLSPKPLLDPLELPAEDIREADEISTSLLNIEKTNKKITQNNTYKTMKDKIQVLPLPDKPVESELVYAKAITKAGLEYDTAKAFVDKMSKLHGTCPTCLSAIDEDKVNVLVALQRATMRDATLAEKEAQAEYDKLRKERAAWDAAQKSQENWEKYHQLIDDSIPSELLDEKSLKDRYDLLQKQITSVKTSIAKIEKSNAEAIAHNSKIEHIKAELVEMNEELESWAEKLHSVSGKLNILNTLVKTFSTTGLVAYKIENLVKDLEVLSNEYLGELSGGRFQISFQISGSDKLNVVITDNGTDIDILALSGGERARVNVATLLAIRRLMQSLSQSRINLLILDETISNLDSEGKEKLIEVLLTEHQLNTVLVSHDFTHPLIEKVLVIKENSISRLEV